MRRLLFLILTMQFMAASLAFGQGTWETVKEKTSETAKTAYEGGVATVKDAKARLDASRENRGSTKWSIVGEYSLFETWVLSKKALAVAYNENSDDTYEIEYATGSLGWGSFGIDIGEIKEQRFTLQSRSYNERKTFSFITGLYYNMMSVQVGNALLASVAGSAQSSVKFLELGTVGATWGFGQRWQTKKGYVWGADWFMIHWPLFVTEESVPFLEASNSEERRKDVGNALKLFKRVPEFAVLKIQLGYSF
ncbi:MAG: hypothetical protein EOP04_15510 [Proteobacteria bacterium]|nr:MAG: hypothetical protein EOP04_15510 [Pseudomonadota bacterium]